MGWCRWPDGVPEPDRLPNHDEVLWLVNQGLKSLKRSGHGDLLARIVIPTPSKVSDKAKKVFQELEQLPEAKVGAPRRPSEDVLP